MTDHVKQPYCFRGEGRCEHCIGSCGIEEHEALLERVRTLEKALRVADRALLNARDGLDFGLGCACDLEGDEGTGPTGLMARRLEAHLEAARGDHRIVHAALQEAGTLADDALEEDYLQRARGDFGGLGQEAGDQ